MLVEQCGGREKICQDVYNYWAGKRKKWGKPIMRRLRAPTPCSDTNPFNTFRYFAMAGLHILHVLLCDFWCVVSVLFVARHSCVMYWGKVGDYSVLEPRQGLEIMLVSACKQA